MFSTDQEEMKSLAPFFIILCVATQLCAQSSDSLTIPDIEPAEVKRVFNIEVNPSLEYKILKSSGEKLDLYSFQITLNGNPLEAKSCNTRGNNTLKFRRKSFSVSLSEPIDFDGIPVKKLAINNLAMDRNYWRNRLSFLLMNKIGVFPLKNEFSELRINGKTQGTYLTIQKSDDFIRSLGSSILVRREANGSFTLEESKGNDAKDQLKRLKKGRKLTKNYSGPELYDSLNQIIIMDQYFKWLAFNYLVMNGDYTDELFFFLHPEHKKFDIIPWDYDDVFARQPHEGWHNRNLALSDRLLFSSESYFDVVIDKDDYLYQEYLRNFDEVLGTLTPEVIKMSFEQVYSELHPFFTNPSIVAQSEYDLSGLTDIEMFKSDLQAHYQFTLSRRSALMKRIASDKASIAR